VVDVEFYVVDGFVAVEEFGCVGRYRNKHNQRHTNPKRSIQITTLSLPIQNNIQKMFRNMRKPQTSNHSFFNIDRIDIKISLKGGNLKD